MSTLNPDTPTGNPPERNGNGSLGSGGASSPNVGSTAAGMAYGPVPDPVMTQRSHGWLRSGRAHRSEFGAFLDDLSELARGGGHSDLRSEIERRVSQARSRMSDALDQGVEMGHRAREQMQRGIDYSRDTVSERPLSSMMVVAVGGLIVGLLLSRRD